MFNQVTAHSHTVIKFEVQLLLYKLMTIDGITTGKSSGMPRLVQRGGRESSAWVFMAVL